MLTLVEEHTMRSRLSSIITLQTHLTCHMLDKMPPYAEKVIPAKSIPMQQLDENRTSGKKKIDFQI